MDMAASLRDDALPEESLIRLPPAIVGSELRLEAWSGRSQLGQSRSLEDQQAVIAGLLQSRGPQVVAMAEFMGPNWTAPEPRVVSPVAATPGRCPAGCRRADPPTRSRNGR
jgi:hypothetical protein